MTPSQQAAMKLALEALKTAQQGVLEMNHAYFNPNWFTKGEKCATQQFMLWRGKATEAITPAIAAIRAELDRQDAPVIEHGFTHSPEKRRV